MRYRSALVPALLLVAACVGSGVWELAGEPGLLFQVKQYYERNATEEAGYCTSPILDGVVGSEVVADDEDELVVRVRYAYRDAVRDDEDCEDDPAFRPARCLNPRCRGWNERTFTIARTADGLEVVGMSGATEDPSRRDWSRPQPSRNAASPRRNMRSVR